MNERKPLILYDTDMDTDCDDAGALAMLYEYVRRGQAELLGVVADAVSEFAAPCCETIGEYYGIRRPIGAVYADFCPDGVSERFTRYRAHVMRCGDRLYNRALASRIGKRDTDYPSAVRMYRQLLAASPDSSVTVVCVGLLTAAAGALASAADAVSPLTGAELFARKVKCVVSMGMPDTDGPNFNWEMDGEGAQRFFELCPVPVYVSGAGVRVITGAGLSGRFPADHPVRVAYETFTGAPGRGRASWDLIAALYALEGDSERLYAGERGTCRFDSAAHRSYWETDGGRRDREILVRISDEELAAYLDARMAGDF